MIPWENGSDFHYISDYPTIPQSTWHSTAIFYNSGRQAIADLLAHLKSRKQVIRIWLPAFYCGEVIGFLPEYDFLYYDCDPSGKSHLPLDDVSSRDVVLLNSYFGVNLPEAIIVESLRLKGITTIEDHSQDPYSALATSSQADYCFASLRKTVPLPDGGVLWSPTGASLPLIPANQPPVSVKRMAAMLAKKSYLNSEWPDKPLFRQWFIESEAEFDLENITQISATSLMMLEKFDINRWREDRLRNYRTFCNAVTDKTKLVFDPQTTHPMGILMLEDSRAIREELKSYLLKLDIYPAVLWPVDDRVPAERSNLARDFAERCLFIHCDGRYASADMLKIAEFINKFRFAKNQNQNGNKVEIGND